MEKQDEKYLPDGYYDGIPEYIRKMTLDELNKLIEEETKKCEEMNK